MLARAISALALTLTLALPAQAAPRDEALRLTPGNFALTFVVQDLRGHSSAVIESPFAAWFPTSALGKKFFASSDFKSVTDSSTPLFAALGVTPSEVFHDILGDAVVFAYAPAAPGGTPGERSIILVRPRKPELLAQVIDRVNDAQVRSKELKAVVSHKHAGEAYFERQKADGASDFYCFRGSVFALSGSEAEVKAVIDRDRTAPKGRPPELVARMAELRVADAAAVLLIHPRPLDAELAAKVKNAPAGERGFLTKFAEVWRATEAAAVYFALDAGAEAGVSVRFDPAKLPAGAKSWLTGERTPSALWGAIPNNALAAVAGRVKPNDLLDFLGSLTEEGKPTPRETIEQALGPIIGKDKLPTVLDALGPDWGAWVLPPTEGTGEAKDQLPVAVAAVKVQDGKNGEASMALLHSLEYGFQAARVAYNARHKDQIELREEKDGDAVVTSLAGEGLPPGFRPCFALKGGYLLVSTSPDAVKSFQPPAGGPKAGGDVPLARFNATTARAYLTSHAAALAKLLTSTGAGDGNEKTLAEQLGGLAALLEPADRVELLARGDAAGLKLVFRVKTARPLKK